MYDRMYKSLNDLMTRYVPITIHSNTWLQYVETGNVLFNDALNTFYLRLYGVTHMKTRCRHMGYSFRLAARVLL